MLRLIRTCAVALLVLQLFIRGVVQFGGTTPMEIVSVTDMCLLCLIVTTSYMGIACDEKLSARGGSFPRLYRR